MGIFGPHVCTLEEFGYEHHKVYGFAVRGSGPFPFILLFRERAWPARAEDALALTADGERTIRILTVTTPGKQPDRAAWTANGWEVVTTGLSTTATMRGADEHLGLEPLHKPVQIISAKDLP